MSGLEDLELAVGPRADDGAVQHDRVPDVHQHRRVVDDIDLGVGAGVDARPVHAAGISRVHIDRAAGRIHIRHVDEERAERIQVADLPVLQLHAHLDALQLLLQGGDVGLIARDGLRVRGMLGLHPRQRADLLADDILLAGVAQRGLGDVHRLQHEVQLADVAGGCAAEVRLQGVAHLGGSRIAQVHPIAAIGVVLRRQIQIAAVRAVVAVVAAVVLDDHPGRDVDLDVAGAERRQLIAHVDIDRAWRSVQAGLARAQQFLQDRLDRGRIRVEPQRSSRSG